MSAFKVWVLRCEYPGCIGELHYGYTTLRDARREAHRVEGWATTADYGNVRMKRWEKDYCALHADAVDALSAPTQVKEATSADA